MTFDCIYRDAIANVFEHGYRQHNKRTDAVVLSTHGYSFRWDMKYYPVTLARPMYVKTGAAELAWMLSGTKSTTWLKKYTKIWNSFETGTDELETAYGVRWKQTFGVDQIANIISKLKADPTSRQQILLSWDPTVDNVVTATNVPCPFVAVINIINNKLNIHLTLRSNDVYLGLPYDVMVYTLLGQALAKQLDIKVGELFYSIAHMHLYENQFAAARFIKDRHHPGENRVIELDYSVTDIINNMDAYVVAVRSDLTATNYQPEVGPPKVSVIT